MVSFPKNSFRSVVTKERPSPQNAGAGMNDILMKFCAPRGVSDYLILRTPMLESLKLVANHLPISKGRLVYFAPAMIAAIAIGLFAVYVDFQGAKINQDRAKADTSQRLSLLKAKLEGSIDRTVALAQGLSEAIAENSTITPQQWEPLTARILAAAPQIRDVAIAPDLKVAMVYPLKGNEKALGLDYLKEENQRDAALTVQQTKRPLLTGPIHLVQGGMGLIARFPLISGDDAENRRFRGIVSAVIDLDRLYKESGLSDPSSSLHVAIASTGPTHPKPAVFFGDPLLLDSHPVTMTINLGYDDWTLYAVPANGWPSYSEQYLSRMALLSIALLFLAPMVWAGKLMADRQGHITALQAREDELTALTHRLELALKTSKIGVWEFDISAQMLHWDMRMRNLYDIPSDQVACTYADWENALHADDLEDAVRRFEDAIEGKSPYATAFRICKRDGSIRHIKAFGTVYQDSSGHKKIIGVNWDVTEDVQLQEELREAKSMADLQNRHLEEAREGLERIALHDPLTGLPNRRFLDKAIREYPDGRKVTVLHMDLDRFKEVNDTFGHAAGDLILQRSAEILQQNIYEGDFIARIGGDEFVVLSAKENESRDYIALAQRLVEALSRPILYERHECRIGASVGLATGILGVDSPEQLLINADIALYEAKRKGRNRVETFTKRLREVALDTKKCADDLLRGIEQNEFLAWYQPQFDATTLEIKGFEALARWQHPDKGILTPDKFLTIAENLHVVSEIDSIVLNCARGQYVRMLANGTEVPRFSVNVSAQRLKDENLLQELRELTLKPGTLSIELLESISFEADDGELLRRAEQLKEIGVEVEIDDFGTGRASIVTLLKLMPRRLKIAREIIQPIVSSQTQRALVASIIDIGQSRGIEIVAEGVETLEHAKILRNLGCHTLQGYAFARPMSGADFVAFAKARTWFPSSRASRAKAFSAVM